MPLANDTLPPVESFPVLEDGTYQVVIKDINDFPGKNFNTGEPENRYQFDLEVLEGENKGLIVKVWTSTKYAAAKSGKQESKLFTITTKAHKKVIPSDELRFSELIGKQLRVVVAIVKNAEGNERNKVVSFLEAKTDLPVEKTKVVEKEKEEPGKDNIDLSDLPF